MAYTTDIVEALVETIGKFATLNAYQLAGHVANLEFWATEVQHAVGVLDGFEKRDRDRMRAEKEHIGGHDTRSFSEGGYRDAKEYPEHYSLAQAKPGRASITREELTSLRRKLEAAFYVFLQRAHKERLVAGASAKSLLGSVGIGVAPYDFQN